MHDNSAGGEVPVSKNKLYYGDNLDVLRKHVADESVDLVYLDPPFNSNRSYNVIFGKHDTMGNGAAAQIQAFDDTWRWTPLTEQQYEEAIDGGVPGKVADALVAMRGLLTENDAMAYIVNMAPRLVQLRRVLKPTGSLFLHCDPTASHYLKIMLDAIFGPERFRNELIWKRSTAHSDARQGSRQAGRIHDVIFFYTRGNEWTWNILYHDYDLEYVESKYRYRDDQGRRYRKGDLTAAKPGGDTAYEWRVKRLTGSKEWHADLTHEWREPRVGWEYRGISPYKNRYWAYSRENMTEYAREDRIVYTSTGMPEYKRFLDEMPGVPLQDVWTDIDPINAKAAERLGYPTQKPLALLERIIRIASNEGDVVLDPFCGCGTTVDAAERLNRRWIGIDITYIAIDLIEKRLRHTYGPLIADTYDVLGIPRDLGGAEALFNRSPFDFERWAVSLINAQPNEKQVGDKGIDGVARFPLGTKGGVGRVLVSVKGGKTVTPQYVRDLVGTVETQKAQMGTLITMTTLSKGVLDAVAHAGTYTWPVNGETFPRVQAITVRQLLKGERPRTPPLFMPYIQARKLVSPSLQGAFDF